jgi:hypothetical protein
VVEDPPGDLVLASPPHVVVATQSGEDPVQGADLPMACSIAGMLSAIHSFFCSQEAGICRCQLRP